ncbi:hypothetical protein F383_34568 [Gossypium arboreum]|uniref:Uncharacterized protein n=1 Tax=Gossypium arboreum TaxID=29729 RepID=A0A0B0PMB6_GOSAR|nr:hypothetical protein F383_34568 [Gossypium arboreum]
MAVCPLVLLLKCSQYALHGLTHGRVTGCVVQVSILPIWHTA